MPPKRSLNTSSNKKKRSASPDGNTGDLPGGKTTKKHKADDDLLHQPHPSAALSEEHGIVLRKYYPAEMSNARARAYNEGTIRRPAEELAAALEETAEARALIGASGDATAASVVHWFRRDLRTADNRGLRLASEKARDLGNGGGDGGDGGGVPLVGLYVLCAADLEAHLEAPARVDFALRSLAVLRADLAARFDIPLHVEVVGEGCDVVPRVLALARDRWRAAWLFANMEYEVDELRRDARLVRLGAAAGAGGDGGEGGDGGGLAVEIVHDACVVPPGALATGAGRQYSVYTPWFRAWAAHLAAHPGLLAASEPPLRNPPGARTADGRFAALFASSSEIPEAPHGKRIADAAQAAHLRALWPAGEHAAVERLGAFCARSIAAYASARDFPARADATSSLSPHFAAGTLSARAAVRAARDQGATDTGKNTARLDAGPEGVRRWIGEVAWRDFYKHVLVNWPYVCMNKPFKPEYSDIEWSYNKEHFEAWCTGRTGYPMVDAAMRQLRATGWVHNRARMIAASFLAKDLLIDWRLGERFFMEHLVDGDFASNNGGWGFAASVGADPQPYFRIFNPLLQGERFDPAGDYVRAWVPELRAITGAAAVHDPYARGAAAEASRAGYPRQIVDHKESRERTLKAYKAGIERGKA